MVHGEQEFRYFARIEADADAGFLVTFPDVPEAITHGINWAEALRSAAEALGLALRGLAVEGRDLPKPETREGVPVCVDVADALKLAVIYAFRRAGITKTELARRLSRTETEARRILDPDHGTKPGLLQEALRVLGKTVLVTIHDLA
nr:type II toxin-antitoxin system HicB family antitoxin [uncultured Gellertiella sp.]